MAREITDNNFEISLVVFINHDKRNANIKTNGSVQVICPISLIFTKCDKLFTSPAHIITIIIPLHEKFLQFDWLRAVVFPA